MLTPTFYNYFYPSLKRLTPDMKFGEAFPNLQGVEIEFTEDSMPAQLLNYLNRFSICNLQQLLTFSVEELLPDSKVTDDRLIVNGIINELFCISKNYSL